MDARDFLQPRYSGFPSFESVLQFVRLKPSLVCRTPVTSIPFLSEPLSFETVLIKIAGLSERLNGMKVVQLSDFHYDGLLLLDDLLNQASEGHCQLNGINSKTGTMIPEQS